MSRVHSYSNIFSISCTEEPDLLPVAAYTNFDSTYYGRFISVSFFPPDKHSAASKKFLTRQDVGITLRQLTIHLSAQYSPQYRSIVCLRSNGDPKSTSSPFLSPVKFFALFLVTCPCLIWCRISIMGYWLMYWI